MAPAPIDPAPIDPAPTTGGTLSDPLADVPAWLRPMAPVVAMLAVMWAVEIIDIPLGGRLDRFGVQPRAGRDSRHRVAPILHAGFGHLIANTVPFVVLGGVVAYSGLQGTFAVITALIMAGSRAGMWLFGSSNSVQVGASGLVFGYLTYLLTRGSSPSRWGGSVGRVFVALCTARCSGVDPRHGVSFSGHLFRGDQRRRRRPASCSTAPTPTMRNCTPMLG
ncbi:MAG: rhomboid family intramembrane serine protease [Microthrixaceae bacterium]